MRLILDMAVLGRGMLDPRNRTGIHRVALRLAHGLAQRPRVELSLCCSSPSALPWALAWRDADPILRECPFLLDRRGLVGAHLASSLATMVRARAATPRIHALGRKISSVLERTLWRTAPPIPLRALADCETYLSPFDPLPPRATMPRATRALFVHDLIPLLFPGLSGEGGAMRRILGSIGPTDRIVTISASSRDDLLRLGYPGESVSIAPLFADPILFHTIPDGSASAAIPAAPYVLALGNLEPRKNLQVAIQAFAASCATGAFGDHVLVLTGAGGDKHGELVPDAIRERVLFTGRVPDADLGALYRGARVFLFPSLYEGFGLPVLEAMQCGTPVLASSLSSMPEVVGDAGLLADPGVPGAFAAELSRLLSDSDLRDRLAVAGPIRAAAFSADRFLESVLEALAPRP